MRNNKTMFILIIVISILIVALIGGIIFIAVSKAKNKPGKVVVNATDNSEAETQKVKEFNEQFLGYEGEEISGSLVKSLISEVVLNNNSNEEQQLVVKILGTDIEDGTTDTTELVEMQEKIDTKSIYEVILGYDEQTGYIDEITIEKTNNTVVSPEVERFNQKFAKYQDKTIKGEEVKGDLATLIKDSNKDNPEHKISLRSGEIKSINEIIDDADYKIKLTYDEEGYISRIDADEQQGNNNLRNATNAINEEERKTANEMENMMNNVLQEYDI